MEPGTQRKEEDPSEKYRVKKEKKLHELTPARRCQVQESRVEKKRERVRERERARVEESQGRMDDRWGSMISTPGTLRAD